MEGRDLTRFAGFPMAKNLRSKIDKSDDMIIHDVNKTVTQQFVDEVGNASIAQSVREVAEKAVCSHFHRRRWSSHA